MISPVYMVAVGLDYYPEGGAGDVVGVYHTRSQAYEVAITEANKRAGDLRDGIWWEVSIINGDGTVETLDLGSGIST